MTTTALSREDQEWVDAYLNHIDSNIGRIWWKGVLNAGWICDFSGNEAVKGYLQSYISEMRRKRLLNRIAWIFFDAPLNTSRYDHLIGVLTNLRNRFDSAMPSLGIELTQDGSVYTGNVGLGKGLP